MGLCPLLRQLGAASARSSSLAAPVQLAPAARQPWLPTPDQPHPASTEQRPGFTQLAGPDALGRRLPPPFTFAVVAQATLRQPHAGVKQEWRLPAPFRTAVPGELVR